MSRPYIFTTPCMYLDINGLQDAIIAAVPAVKSVLRVGDDIHVQSTAPLTTQEETDVNAAKMAFADSDPALKIPKIYTIAKAEAKNKHFHNINYKKELGTALIPKRTIVQGEVRRVDWFEKLDVDGQTPINLIIRVDIVYNRDLSTALPLYRTTTRTWINEDGTDNDEPKVTMKYYFVNPDAQIDEGYKRRGLLVKSIQLPVMSFMVEVLTPLGYNTTSILLMGRAFLDDYESEFNKFVDNSSTVTDPADPDFGMKKVVVRLRDEAHQDYLLWIDKAPGQLGGGITIRQYLIAEFSI